MADDAEPSRNISGGSAGGGETATFDPGTAGTRAEAVVDRLGELYWEKTYGGRDGFGCLVRTILSQNTSDAASQPAFDALLARYEGTGDADAQATDGDPEIRRPGETAETDHADVADGEGYGDSATPSERRDANEETEHDLAITLADADNAELAETIRSAGLYNQKAEMIIGAAEWVIDEFGSAAAFDEYVRTGDPAAVRETLLDVKGVGPKTADCVLLFAGGQGGVFPVDTHVHRIARRMGLAPPDADHETVREHLERDVPGEKCGFGHTAMIQFGREYCKARKPACLDDPEACPLADRCDQVGVDPAAGEVRDPAEMSSET